MVKKFDPRDEERKRESKVVAAGATTEAEMRESEAPWPATEEELVAYIRSLVDRPHTYGTCCYAMSLAAVAAFNYVAKKLGVTGFQASCADLDILRQTRSFRWGKLLNYEDLLYPQYCNDEHFPTAERLLHINRKELAEKAAEKLKDGGDHAAPGVVEHWKRLVRAGKLL